MSVVSPRSMFFHIHGSSRVEETFEIAIVEQQQVVAILDPDLCSGRQHQASTHKPLCRVKVRPALPLNAYRKPVTVLRPIDRSTSCSIRSSIRRPSIKLASARSKLLVLHPTFPWQFPIIDTPPPSSNLRANALPTVRGTRVPMLPSSDRKSPRYALHEWHQYLRLHQHSTLTSSTFSSQPT